MDIFEKVSGPSGHIYVTLYHKTPPNFTWNEFTTIVKKIFSRTRQRKVSQVHNQFFPDIVHVKEAEHLKTFVYVYLCACIYQCQQHPFIKWV